MLAFRGSMASELTARLGRRSPAADQDVPPVVVFQTPPAAPAAYIVPGELGSMTMARVRPPMLPGPRKLQVDSALATPPAMPGEEVEEGSFSESAEEYRGMLSLCAAAAKYRS